MLAFLFYCFITIVCVGVVLTAGIQTLKANASGSLIKVFVQLLLFYMAYLMPLLLIWVLWQSRVDAISTQFALVVACFALLYLYARLIEPNQLLVKQHQIHMGLRQPIKFAVIADIHVGLFSGKPQQLKKIVNKINKLDVDVVLVAGDWTYEPGSDLTGQMLALGTLNKPCYAVLGNHDEQEPGPPVSADLRKALKALNILDIEALSIDLGVLNLVGVGDLWASKAEFHHFSYDDINDKPTLILAHNPDTVNYIPEALFINKPLMVSGHTHGGQVYVPKLTEYLFAKHSQTGYCEGLYQHANAQVFVTAGIGMVFVPFRINMPPRIDILTIS